MTNFWICFLGAFILLAIVLIPAYYFFKAHEKLVAYLIMIIGAPACFYGGFQEIWDTSETVNWFHKVFGVCVILSGVYLAVMLIRFLRLEFRFLFEKTKTSPLENGKSISEQQVVSRDKDK